MSDKIKFISSALIGIIVLSIVIATEIKIKNQEPVNFKSVFIMAAILGFIMCCIGKAVKVNGWTNPFVIACILLGTAVLIFMAVFLLGKINITYKTAFRILYLVIFTKWGLTTIHHIVNFVK